MIALLIGSIPNIFSIIIKYIDKKRPREELSKTVIESADISLDMLQTIIDNIYKHNEYLNNRLNFKQKELDICRDINLELNKEILRLETGIDIETKIDIDVNDI